METRLRGIAAATACAWALVSGAAWAQDKYPSRPIRLVIPFAPGGGSDVTARLLGPRLAERLGQPVVIDNRPAASGVVGADIVAKAVPDGYTLLGTTVTFVINGTLQKGLPYDAFKDFAPVSVIAATPYILVVNPQLPYAGSLKDFIAAAKAQPGKLALGSAGSGSVTHMTGGLFRLRAGINMTHVPYKSVGPAMADVVGGQIPATFSTPPTSLPLVKAGRLRILAAAVPKRSALLPDVPTFSENGLTGVVVTNWYGIMTRGGTPQPVIRKLHDELIRAIATPDMRTRLANAALEPAPNDPAQFRKLIAAELERWKRVMKEAGIQQE